MGRKGLKAVMKKQDIITRIVSMTCNGVPQAHIIQWMRDECEIEISYCYVLLKEAKPIIQKALQDLSKDRLETTINELEKLYANCLGMGEKKLALEIKKEINKISGLHQQQIDLTTKGEKINAVPSVIKLIQIKSDLDDGENSGDQTHESI